eukprot:CAMPEP_0116878546 /NCGR_PEP_ID=MMETSP0463-20121206/10293_1 /TAXON_ID=181622 /ORGANISM="Strombidinopsis sp, Strain SopsisLIS2011" /LENGTH=42 /DNA_ID= /DNA_START= /DNA_END= /DNA_ORIENTATION=
MARRQHNYDYHEHPYFKNDGKPPKSRATNPFNYDSGRHSSRD